MNLLSRYASHWTRFHQWNRSLSSFMSTTTSSNTITNVTIFGSGLMGAGIAQVCAQAKCKVTLVDVSEKAVKQGQSLITKSLERVAKKTYPTSDEQSRQFVDSVLSNIVLDTSGAKATINADLVIEAVIENLELKRKIWSEIDKVAPNKSIFASNTSSLKISDLASATTRPSLFVGLHFFNPVPQMGLVEVIRTPTTSQNTFDQLIQFTHHLGKTPVACKDTPGFVVNRLLVPYLMEAIRIVERNEASIADVDAAMKLGAGYPMGPFQLADFVGLDTVKFIIDGWFKNGDGLKGKELVAPSQMLNKLVAEGKLGRKSGAGFYDYSKKK